MNKTGLVPGFEGTRGVLAQNRGDLLNLDIDKTDYLFDDCLLLPGLTIHSAKQLEKLFKSSLTFTSTICALVLILLRKIIESVSP